VTSVFVTGTDTGVGKTRVATAVVRALARRGLRVAAMKPVASGCVATSAGPRNEDALALMAAANVRARYPEVNPFAFLPAIAPHIAAREAQVPVDFDVLDRCRERLQMHSQVLVIEGAGGWLAPLDDSRSFADLAAHWRTDVLLVVGLRLGCLNHALLTVESIERRGLRLVGWVASAIDPTFERLAENVATLEQRIVSPCLGALPFDPDAGLNEIADGIAADTLLSRLGLS
jgi:dethiobiotin synthetase